jgi:predicted dehydrogenase
MRVDHHTPATIPSIKASKKTFVEWPLVKNLSEAEEVLRLSKEPHVTETTVCLQGRFAPVVMKLKKLVKRERWERFEQYLHWPLCRTWPDAVAWVEIRGQQGGWWEFEDDLFWAYG